MAKVKLVSKKSAKPTKPTKPDHYTASGTRKYQAQGPVAWSTFFKSLAEKIGGRGAPEGLGIRACLAYAVGADPALMAKPYVVAPGSRIAPKGPRAIDMAGAAGKAAAK
jgi:hypothetical protein